VATARGDRSAPDPIAHATPDSELAEAQMALGRPELSDEPQNALEQAEADEELLAEEEAESAVPGVIPGRPHVEEDGAGDETSAPLPAAPAPSGNRLINFIQGSWRELQRVQWPDRRQVVQATGVVIGFVIVAGVYLGVADWAAGKIVRFIIK
jgi:preprotein translocase SecE subunit